MSFHHLAIATRDMPATHAFYSAAMGFDLVRVEKARAPTGGWAKHFFYDTGNGEMMAFWELHDDSIPKDFATSISEGLGLPQWTNHIAFAATDLEDLAQKRDRLRRAGHRVMELDHHWCTSIYATDPNGIMVEFCVTTAAFTAADAEKALSAVNSDELPDDPPPIRTMWEPLTA